jgi:chromatin remodeling complex protein RSC6
MATKQQKSSKFMQPMNVSEELAAVVGKGPMPRTKITQKVWAYIKSNKLQDPKNLRNIIPDEKLAKVVGKKTINMFELTKLVNKHLS